MKKNKFEKIFSLLKKRKLFLLFLKICNKLIPQWLLFLGKSELLLYAGQSLEIKHIFKNSKVKRATIVSLPNIVQCSNNSNDNSMFELYYGFIKNGSQCFYIEYKNQIIGYIWVFFDNYILTYDDYKRSNIVLSFNKDTVFFGNGYINPAFRLRGFFPLLISRVISILNKERSINKFIGNIEASNVHSLKSHMRLGFKNLKTYYFISTMFKSILFSVNPEKRL